MCLQWTTSGHSKGQNADIPYALPGFYRLRCIHLQTSGSARSVPGHHASSDGQYRRELCAIHELRLLPASHPLHSRTAR